MLMSMSAKHINPVIFKHNLKALSVLLYMFDPSDIRHVKPPTT